MIVKSLYCIFTIFQSQYETNLFSKSSLSENVFEKKQQIKKYIRL